MNDQNNPVPVSTDVPDPSHRDGVADSVKRMSASLIAVGLFTYAAMSAVSITGADIGLILAIAGAIPLWLARSPLSMNRGLVIGLAVYGAVKLLTSVLALDPGKGIDELVQYWPYLILAVVPLTQEYGPSRESLLRVLAVSCMLVSIYAIWQHFMGYEYWHGRQLSEIEGRYRVSGLFSHPQTWAGFTLVATLFFGGLATTARSDRRMFAVTSLICLAANFTSNTRGALIGLIAGAILMAFANVRMRRVSLAMLGLMIMGVALSPGLQYRFNRIPTLELDPDQTNSRLYIWNTSISMGASRPLIGVGPGNFRDSYVRFCRIPPKFILGHAHNEWIHEWATSGILGVLSFSALLALMSRALWKRHRQGSTHAWPALVAWVGLAAASLVQCHFRDEEVLMLILFVVAFGLMPVEDSHEAGIAEDGTPQVP